MTQIRIVQPATKAQKATRTTQDTWDLTIEQFKELALPPFQRPLKVNSKVQEVGEEIKASGGVVPGVITIGVLDGKRYLVDGQHRREGFMLSGCKNAFFDVRVMHFDKMSEMAEEFARLNSRLVNMKPDDLLRAYESTYPTIAKVRKLCPFVGYDNVRRGEKSPVISMSTALRCWTGSAHETPHTAGSATDLAERLTEEEGAAMVGFLELAFGVWGRDPQFYRLWGNLNMIICMWIYRRIVLSSSSHRVKVITKDQWSRCLHSISAAEAYIDYLLNRTVNKQSLSPTYQRLRGLVVGRIEHDTGGKYAMPAPDWSRAR